MTAAADRLTEIVLGGLFQLLQDHRGDFGRRVAALLVARKHAYVAGPGGTHAVRHHLHLFVDFVVAPAHEALDREDGVLRIRHGLTLGDLSDEALPDLVKATTDGVSRLPSWLAITTGSPPSMTATTEFVVPRSIPMILLMSPSCVPAGGVRGARLDEIVRFGCDRDLNSRISIKYESSDVKPSLQFLMADGQIRATGTLQACRDGRYTADLPACPYVTTCQRFPMTSLLRLRVGLFTPALGLLLAAGAQAQAPRAEQSPPAPPQQPADSTALRAAGAGSR